MQSAEAAELNDLLKNLPSVDEVLLPSGQDLATGRDPQLARAIALAGGSTTAEQAGTLFPVIWRRKD